MGHGVSRASLVDVIADMGKHEAGVLPPCFQKKSVNLLLFFPCGEMRITGD